jgi:hypothetical protein
MYVCVYEAEEFSKFVQYCCKYTRFFYILNCGHIDLSIIHRMDVMF